MGDLRDGSPEPNGIVSEERPSSTSSSSSSSLLFSSTQPAVGEEYWQRAEEATLSIIAQVQPTIVSEERRKAVIDYVQRLLRNHLGCEVFPFGSVPLKTYLPDGDIDLTAFGGLNLEEALAQKVCSVLQSEDQNMASEFVVKDVQLIRAEVKLVKCLVQNIMVDISFNQLGGLCTLCFLEQVDRLIGKDHLFKRSIILIKAWCYYESRILGAHHGLISTYALETLVLYIFHLFHSSLNGPLAVLYKFLDYFSKFDWDNYSISLSGPILISSLPKFVVETPENGEGGLLLSNDFLKDCAEMFSVPSRGFETTSRTFPQKHLNIVDPLKENNNLGRSVSKGNFYRIRSAFTYGARKLGHILSQAEVNIADELHKFFANTLHRHGSGQRPDVQDQVPVARYNGFAVMPSFSGSDSLQENQMACVAGLMNSSSMNANCKMDHDGNQVYTSRNDRRLNGTNSEFQSSANGTAVSENRFCWDSMDLATSRVQGLTISNDSPKSYPSDSEESVSALGRAGHTLHLNTSCSSLGDGEMGNGNAELKYLENSSVMEKKVSSGNESPVGPKQPLSLTNSTWALEDLYPGYSCYLTSTVALEKPAAPNSLSDLCGDYESHQGSLQYGRWCCEYALNAHVPSISAPLLPQYQSKNSWDMIRRSVQFKQNVISPMNTNGFVPRPVIYSMNLHSAGFGMEEMPKPRGTGTYFPNTNHYTDGSWTGRGRNHASARSPHSNGHAMTTTEGKSPERRSRELLHVQSNAHQVGGKSVSSELSYCKSPEKMFPSANGAMGHPDNTVEFGSLRHSDVIMPQMTESSQHAQSGSPVVQNSSSSHLGPGVQLKQTSGVEQDRIAVQSYQLKDEDDFPPLSERLWKR